MRGRKPALMAIEGGLSGVPPMPAHLPQEMANDWTAAAGDLAHRGLLTDATLGVLASYVTSLWIVRQAQQAIAEHGALVRGAHGALKPNPAAGMLSKANEAVARLAAELGITPAARSRKSMQPTGGETNGGAPPGLAV